MDYKKLEEEYGPELARIMKEREENKIENKPYLERWSEGVERYGSVFANAVDLKQRDENRRRLDGSDYLIKDALKSFEDDPAYISAMKAKQKREAAAADDERFVENIHKELKEREKHGQESWEKYYANKEW